MNEHRKPNKAVTALIITVLLGAIAAGGAYVKNSNSTSNTSYISGQTSSADTSSTSTPSSSSDDEYKDGTYDAEGSYTSPAGQETIKVELTISNNKVSAANVVSEAEENSTSQRYQEDFISGYKELVVGKSVDAIKLDRVSGSSLTPNGFNSALEIIKKDAAA